MKSLDIDSISTDFSVYGSRRIIIEFTGSIHSERNQEGVLHTAIVPYSSLSKRIQTIHRLGGKITNISIPHLDAQLPQINTGKVNQENIIALIPEDTSVIEGKSNNAVTLENALDLVSESNVLDQPEISSEFILKHISELVDKEHISQVLPSIEAESIATAETSPVTTKKKKSTSDTVTKPRKPRASTKSSGGFSKQSSKTQVVESIAIAQISETSGTEQITVPNLDEHQISEPVAETGLPVAEIELDAISEKAVEQQILQPQTTLVAFVPELVATVPESISEVLPEVSKSEITNAAKELEVIVKTEPQPESDLLLAKPKKSRKSTKTGNGFNKLEGEPQVPKSKRKTKS